MVPSTREDRIRLIIGSSLFAALAVLVFWFTYTGELQRFIIRFVDIFEHRETARDYLRSWGSWAPIVFIAVQGLQVVFAPIPGEATGVAGGFFFGTLPTVLYSTIGLTLGSIVAFVASRIMGLPLVKLMAKQETIDKFRFVTAPRGTIAVLVLFMIPGFPKDILSYLLGLSPMKFRNFVVVCGLGRIPGTLMLAVAGSSLYKENWYLLAAVSLVCIVCLTVLYFRGERIKAWIKEKT